MIPAAGKSLEIDVGQARLRFLVGDITTISADAIVNAANPSLEGGGGVDGAIHWAGGAAIAEECRRIVAAMGRCRPGQAVITGGGKLPARFVIHTVGPVWRGGSAGEDEILADAYRNSIALAEENGLTSLAFPSISTGAYGYPVKEAAAIAVGTVAACLGSARSLREVSFVLFDHLTYRDYAAAALAWRQQSGNQPPRATGAMG